MYMNLYVRIVLLSVVLQTYYVCVVDVVYTNVVVVVVFLCNGGENLILSPCFEHAMLF